MGYCINELASMFKTCKFSLFDSRSTGDLCKDDDEQPNVALFMTKMALKRLWWQNHCSKDYGSCCFKKLNSMKPKADKELNVYGTMQEVTPRLKLEWNLKMRYNSQIRKRIYQLWQVIIRLLRWQIHEKMAIFRLKSNFTNIAPLCTWMPVELNFVIFLGITHFFSLFWIGQSKSARYYTNRFVYIQNAIKNCQKLCCNENGQLTTGVEKERSTSFRWKRVGRHWAVDWEHDKQYAVVLLQSY